MKVGIIGCGFVGTALKTWLEENNPDAKVFVSDPPKGMNDDLTQCDVFFIQIHLPTEADGTQDLTTLTEIINGLPNKPIYIRTTILPGTSKRLSDLTHHTVYHMPEFLTQRTFIEDFKWQPMVFTGDIELLKKVFPGKTHIDMTSEEAEMVKYAHNVFGALKVTYFNCVYDLCQRHGLDYETVRRGVLGSTYINGTHTRVPGPDGLMGFGGKCFPKDLDAFQTQYRDLPMGKLLSPVKELNDNFRSIENIICS